jgi:hypothetical protein
LIPGTVPSLPSDSDSAQTLVQFGSGYWEEDQNVKSKRTPDAQSCHGKSSPELSTGDL